MFAGILSLGAQYDNLLMSPLDAGNINVSPSPTRKTKMDSKTQAQPSVERRVERRKPQPRTRSRNYGWYVFLLSALLLLIAGYIVSTMKLYRSGDDLGYNMGLAGGLMLLALLLYPLRKRAGFMKDIGLLPNWFKWHMILGILGPTMILFHSTFRIGSINAGVALVCMLLVAGSGIFGRFFYTKIHNGLYGRQLNLRGLHSDMEKTGSYKRSIAGFAPDIEDRLEQFRVQAEGASKGGRISMRDFVWIGLQAEWLSWSLTYKLHRVMYGKAREKQWGDAQMKQLDKLYGEYRDMIRSYLLTVLEVAQFHTYERLFSGWHIFHIPLVYMLFFSAVFHVISVHMY
jgi:hypothetical protein